MTSEDRNPHRVLYDGIAEWYVRTFYSDFSDLDWLQLFANVVPSAAVIADIGSGPGQFARTFRDYGHRTISMDLAERMLTVGRRLDPELSPVVSDIRRIPLATESLGGILAAYTLEHVRKEDTVQTISEMARCLRPGGAVALMVKCGRGFYEFRSSLVKGARGYVQLWDLDELSAILRINGFDIVFADRKAPVSAEEFNHERGFALARKL